MNSEVIVVLLVVVVCGFAVMTKPSDDDLRRQIYSQILAEAKQLKVENNDNLFSGVMKFACRLSPDECARQIYNTMVTINVDDKVVFKKARVNVAESQSECVGFFNTWKC
ncbi:hypothetical protein JCM17961_47480 [Endothiovibrio diazotrophicus]